MKPSLREPHYETSVAEALSASTFVAELIAACPPGVPLDAPAVLAEHPELIHHKSALLELAYEDFCRRDDLGIPVEPGEFASRFPTISRSLLHQIEVHLLLADGPADESSATDPQWPAAGQVWLDFQLLEELGRGAYSRVYLAREKSLGDRLVVVKATSLGPREAHTLGRLQHPHIVPVHSMQRDERLGLTAVCMPFLSRVSLFDVMDALFSSSSRRGGAIEMLHAVRRINAVEGAEPETAAKTTWPAGWSHSEAVVCIGIQLAQALQHAHRQGVLHGDVKPSNVLITNSGRAVLLDFNLAIFGEESAPFVAGTLPYMAPEQLRPVAFREGARRNLLTEHADIFSLGLTLWELLEGQHPFGPLPAETSRERFATRMLERYQRGIAASFGRIARCDRSIAEVLRACLEFDPARRPQSMGELVALLGAQLKSLPRVRRWLSRHRRLALSTAALSFAGLVALSGWQLSREPYSVREWRKGEAAYRQNQYGDAVPHLTHVLDEDPQADEARLLRGIAYFRMQDLGRAHDDLKLLCRQPSDGRARAALAHVTVVREENFNIATGHYKQAIQEGYQSALIYNNLGYCLFMQGNLNEAAEALRTAISLNHKMGIAYHNLGRVETQWNTISQRIADPDPMEKAIALGPESSQLYMEAAALYAKRAQKIQNEEEKARSLTRAFDLLEKAWDRGLTLANLNGVASFNPALKDDPRWEKLLQRPLARTEFTRVNLMPDPLTEISAARVSFSPMVVRR
jgi:serine/threonine protein kinase/Tfp pilus assembly protein PilF